MLKDLTIQKFVDDLASSSPAPGGGSASALSASLAAALCSMVFNLTIGKKAFTQLSENEQLIVSEAFKRSCLLKDDFINVMEKDTEVFLELMTYFKLPKNTEEEKEYRKQKINEGYVTALEVPFELAKRALGLYEDILIAATLGNVNAVSDAGVAALLLQTALEGAILNVKINLSALEDSEYKESIRKECERITEEGNSKKLQVMNIVNSKI